MTVSKPSMMSYLCHSEETRFLLCFSEILTKTKFNLVMVGLKTKDMKAMEGGGSTLRIIV